MPLKKLYPKRVRTYKKKTWSRRPVGLVSDIEVQRHLTNTLNRTNNTSHTFLLGKNFQTTLNTTTGWFAANNSMQFVFTLDGLYYSIGSGALSLVGSYANTPYIKALYDKYKITKVFCEITCGSNTSQINATQQFSNVIGVIDNNSSDSIGSADIALAYSTAKNMQMGANTSTDGKHLMRLDNPTTTIALESTGATGQALAMERVSPWLNTENSDVQHFGMKFFNNSVGGAASTQYINFVFRVEVVCKNIY